jgi:protein SCO1/2
MRRTALLAGALLAGSACAPRHCPEPLVRLPEFSMSAVGPAEESPFGLAQMRGRPWVVDFVFTRCGGPCPLLTERMAALAKRLPKEVGLLTVSVDPEGDTPERLRDYARAHAAEEGRWIFLRGPIEDTYRLLYAGFRLPMSTRPEAAPESRVMHSTRFALVDSSGAVRGYYEGLVDADAAALERDARALLEVRS